MSPHALVYSTNYESDLPTLRPRESFLAVRRALGGCRGRARNAREELVETAVAVGEVEPLRGAAVARRSGVPNSAEEISR